MPDTSDGRITLAVIQADIRHLTTLLEGHIRDDNERRTDHETRIRRIENNALPEVRDRINCVEDRVIRVEERQGVLATGQTIFTVIAATIAGWLGVRQ